jgi:FtsP/CotA-like multicopper oxidase with cupredoxin domain
LRWSKRAAGQDLHLRRSFSSQGGLLDAALDARQSPLEVAGRPANPLTFNGQVPGPVLEAHAGDTIRVAFRNGLGDLSNIHYHGLHVDPSGAADNVFLEIPPGESFQYELTVPANHPAGTFFYHPHVHGFTGKQLAAGMSGFLIIRGDLDQIPEVAAATEYLLMLKDYGIRSDGSVVDGPRLTVNGLMNPTIALQQNGLARLRILNTSADLYFRLRLEEHPFYVIATDGGGIPAPVPTTELLIAPAQRYEVLVRGERPPGAYQLIYSPYQSVIDDMGGMPGMGGQPMPPEVVMATVVYDGRAERLLELPSQLVPVDLLPDPGILRSFEFRTTELPGGFVFQINGRDFDHNRVDTSVVLNTVEDWEIVNADLMDHPVHLHTNSFQILDDNGTPERAWRDIVNVRGKSRRRFRVYFQDFVGRMPYHCHRVYHGDLGMMGVLEINRDTGSANTTPPVSRGHAAAHH